MTRRGWEPVQARSANQLKSLRGHQRRPAATELARDLVAQWQWVVDPATGELQDRNARTVAGCIEEVAEAMATLDYFTTQADGQPTGLNWLVIDEAQLIGETAK